MSAMMKHPKVILIASLCTAIYVGGYVACRMNGSIVHQCGFKTDDGKRVVYQHRIETGGGVAEAPRNPIPGMFFTPLRWLEQGAWYAIKPKGSDWPGEIE